MRIAKAKAKFGFVPNLIGGLAEAPVAAEAYLALGDLADAVGSDPSTISRNVRPLVRDGLIDFAGDDDGRKRHARLTPKGVATYNRAYRLWKRVQDEALRLLGDEWGAMREKLGALETELG